MEIFLSHVWEISVTVAIILFAVYGYWCALKIYNVRDEIDGLLESLTPDKNFADVDAEFNQSARLASAWKNFRGSLTVTGGETFSTTDAAEFFNDRTLTQNLNMSFWQSYGGIFTGLGILGTFAGLTYGLRGVDMTSGDVELLKASIAHLLSGVETAFVTSLVGIGCALLYSGLHHALTKNFCERVQLLADRLDEIFPRRTVEDLLTDALNATKNIDDNVAASLRVTEDQRDSVKDIGERIADMLSDGLDEKFGTLSENICAAIGNIGTDAFGKTVGQVAGQEMTQFATALENFASTADALSKSLKETTADNAKQITEAVDAFSKIVEAHKATTEKTFARIEELLSDSENFLHDVHAAGDSLKLAAEPVKQSTEQLSRHLDETTRSAEKFRDEITAQINRLVQENEATKQNLSGLAGQLRDFTNNFNGISKELTATTNAVCKQLEEFNLRMDKGLAIALKHFDKSMGEAFNGLNGTLGGLNKAIEDFDETLGIVKQNKQNKQN